MPDPGVTKRLTALTAHTLVGKEPVLWDNSASEEEIRPALNRLWALVMSASPGTDRIAALRYWGQVIREATNGAVERVYRNDYESLSSDVATESTNLLAGVSPASPESPASSQSSDADKAMLGTASRAGTSASAQSATLSSSGTGSNATQSARNSQPGTTPASQSGGALDTTTGPDQWFNLPGGGELWSIDGQAHVVYQHDTGPYVAYTVPDDQWLEARFPSGVPELRELTRAEANRLGTLTIGTANLLTQNLGDNWQDGFDHFISKFADIMPWLDDPEVVATLLAAELEGRVIEDAELELTEYFSSRSPAEVQYASFIATATDAEVDQYQSSFRNTTRSYLIEAGVRDPDPTLVDFVASKWASGQWSESYAAEQIIAISNPYSSFQVDGDLTGVLSGLQVDTLRGQAENVRALAEKWLGPGHGNSYSEEWYRQWAGAIDDDPNAENDLLDLLKGQRMALYPEYENSSLTYEDISQVWRNEMMQTWGRDPASDGDWAVLDKVIRANDQTEAGRILRSEGLTRGVETVQRNAVQGMLTDFGGQSVASR